MTPKTPVELHREFYERRRQEIEAGRPPRDPDHTELREPSTDGRESGPSPTKKNGHRRR